MSTPVPGPEERTRVIVHFADRTVKGYISPASPGEPAESRPRRGVIRVRRLDGVLEEISLVQTQGVYFVKEFEETHPHENLLFFNMQPQELLWVRLTFRNGEVMEGLIDNSAQSLIEPGFLVTPTDPTSNYRFIFVMKTQIHEFSVLGLRQRHRKLGVSMR